MTVLDDPQYYACIKCRREFDKSQVTFFDGVPKHQLETTSEWHIVQLREDH
jgi:hypothetical protein